MIDPVRFKRTLLLLLKILVILELLSAFFQGTGGKGWARFGADLLIAGVLFVLWERIKVLVRDKKEEYRRRVERSPEHIKISDALVFSLLWSDEIFSDIPTDRRRLVVISYTLIALGLVAAFVEFGPGLMPLIVSGALVLGAVNLVTWVVAQERVEKESLQTELKLAREVQMSLMPKSNPTIPGFDIAGMSAPAQEVGGDLYDFMHVSGNDRKLGISIMDVSGKGMQAAMAAVFTSGAYASEARQSYSPAEILTRLNAAVYAHSKRGHFVAFLLLVLDVGNRQATLANAGQTKPLLRSGATLQWLESVGVHFPLGMRDDSVFQERTIQLQSGDILFLGTDGFADAMNERKEMYGLDRLETVARRPDLATLPATDILHCVTREVRSHVGSAPQHDDMSMVVLKVL